MRNRSKLAAIIAEAYELAEGRRDWTEAFDVAMQDGGATYTGAACSCHDEGEHGHAPQCGWELKLDSIRHAQRAKQGDQQERNAK